MSPARSTRSASAYSEPEMVRPHPLRRLLPRLEQADRPVELAPIGKRAGGHDASLGHDLGARGRGRELLPQLVDLGVLLQRAVAVGEDRQLLGRAGERAERLELACRRTPLAEAVQREAVELAHRCRARRPLGQRLQDLAGLGEPLALECPGCVPKALAELRDVRRTGDLGELRRARHRSLVLPAARRRASSRGQRRRWLRCGRRRRRAPMSLFGVRRPATRRRRGRRLTRPRAGRR